MFKQSSGPGTVVGANVKLQGTLKDTNDIIIHGQLDGELGSEQSVVIAQNATVKGPVSGDTVTVAGTVKGSIDARSKLEILPTGRVQGSISTKELIIQAGAIFNGKTTMPESKDESQKKVEESSNLVFDENKFSIADHRKEKTEKSSRKPEHELEYELE